jgi:magnesium chelatase subunit D
MATDNAPHQQRLEAWHDALTSLQILQLDPHGVGGVCLRAPHGPVRERWLSTLARLGLPLVKVPGSADAERLLGGIDLAHTLQTGQLRMQTGLLQQADQGLICLPMAERLSPALLAPLMQALDTGQVAPTQHASAPTVTLFGVVALDESLPEEAGVNAALQERLGLWLDLQTLSPSEIATGLDNNTIDGEEDALHVRLSRNALARARAQLLQVQASDVQLHALCATALSLGIGSLRAPSLALRVASAHAALNGRSLLDDEDLGFAARCVLAPRATQWPAKSAEQEKTTESPPEPAQPHPEPGTSELPPGDAPAPASTSDKAHADPPQDTQPTEPSAEDLQNMMVTTALASLPQHLLDALATRPGARNSHTAGRSGQTRAGLQRGRPLPPHPGRPGGHARLHVLATLRAAAPRQRLRQAAPLALTKTTPNLLSHHVAIRAEDFHIQRYQQRASSCLILALDASGSAALQRLAEAKGAVELLLQQSYARRDSVCIVAFRGAQAQLLLPATRSLVRAKRAMTGLPGGGGTPLALALKMAHEQATLLQRQGVTPILVMLSDGRANVTLQGLGGRAQAQTDAQIWGQQWRNSGHRALWIDTNLQADAQVKQLAETLGAHYLPMPQVQAQRMAHAMNSLRTGPA